MTIISRNHNAPPPSEKNSAPAARSASCGRETVRHAIADILAHGSVHDATSKAHHHRAEVRCRPTEACDIYVMPLGAATPIP